MSGLANPNMPIIKPLNGLFLKWMSIPKTELFLEQVIQAVQAESNGTEHDPTAAISITIDHAGSRLRELKGDGEMIAVPRSPRRPGRRRLTPPTSPRTRRQHRARTPEGSQKIRRFFFPEGAPLSPRSLKRESALISEGFRTDSIPGRLGLTVEDFFPVTMRICEFSSYCNSLLFNKVLALNRVEYEADQVPLVTEQMFTRYWDINIAKLPPHTRFFRLLRANDYTNHLTRQDFVPIVQEIVDRHPGLEFLEATPKFQLRYAQTVIARIFYQVNRSGNEKLTLSELKRSNFLLTLGLLDEQDDINKINDYFSYEHFYVIFCKFWELDTDHDSLLDASDLLRYEDYALTSKVVQRILDGHARRLRSGIPGRMGYEDFIVFLISEVDKSSPTSLDYWFRCLDIDADGEIRADEINHFFDEQKQRMQALSQEDVHFVDVLCQLCDVVGSRDHSRFTKKDIARTAMGPLFFNMLFNMNKYLITEARDPIRIKQVHATPQLTDWDRYAIATYFALAECDPDDEPDDMGEDLEEWQGQGMDTDYYE